MGCGGSVQKGPKGPKECTVEQQATLCSEHGKQMLLLCVPPALEKADQITVVMPKEFAFLKQSSESLRAQAQKSRETTQAPAGDAAAAAADGEQPAAEKKEGGGGFMGKMAGMAAGAMDKANEMLGKGVGVILDEAAKAIDAAVAKVEDPMSKVGKEIVAEKKEEIAKVFSYVIGQLSLEGEEALKLVRGGPSSNLQMYQAVPGNALSDHLIKTASQKLAAQLSTAVGPAIKAHAALKAWESAINLHNTAIDTLKEKNLPEVLGSTKIEVDVGEHIVQQVIEQLGSLIGKEETLIRQSPAGKSSKCPNTFATVFSGVMLTEETFKTKET